jgi:hypothetical protein
VRKTRRPAPSPPLAAKLLVFVVLALPLLLSLEGTASFVLAWKDARDQPALLEMVHCRHDPDLGWSHRPSLRVDDLYGEGRSLTTNALGLRATEEYEREKPAGRYRVICAGDSFTLGYGVDDHATYEAELEAADPRLQVINMGQGGYGADQAYLWYKRDGDKLDHDLLLFVFIAPDFDRMLSDRFNDTLAKPVLRVRGGELSVENVPVPAPPDDSGEDGVQMKEILNRLALIDLVHRIRRPAERARKAEEGQPLAYRAVAELMLADLQRLAAERGSSLALVELPLRDRVSGRPAEVSAWLRGLAPELGVPFIDLTEAFDALPKGEVDLYFQEDGHYNALGNRLVARILLERLPGAVESFPRP